jgi:hypothetical protein
MAVFIWLPSSKGDMETEPSEEEDPVHGPGRKIRQSVKRR